MKNKIDLDNPKDARLFLRGVRIEGNRIECVSIENGDVIEIDKMSDEQAVRYAKDIYIDFCGGVEGEGGVIELDLNGMNQ